MLAMAVATVAFSSLAGVYLSYHLDSAPAPTIVLVMTALFLVAFVRHLSASASVRPT
jgi:manganese/iron transport system permease protein